MFQKKIETDPYLDKLEAKDPALYEALLLEFLQHPFTAGSLARHGTTPTFILEKIALTKYVPWNDILKHPNCPREVIDQQIVSTDSSDRIAICENPSLNEEQIYRLAKDDYSPVHTWLCRRQDCPPEILEYFFSKCEEQWNSVSQEAEQIKEIDTTSLFLDEDDVFGELIEIAYYEFDETLTEAIASNPNTPQHIFKKIMKMNIKNELLTGGSFGVALMENPSVSKLDKAFLMLQGISKRNFSNDQEFSSLEYAGLPSSEAFEIPNFPIKYLEALNDLGHPSALLVPNLKVTSSTYNFSTAVDVWIKHETIYRTLWPELLERPDVDFCYFQSSYDGDNFYFSCRNVEFEHNFSRGSHTYNSMGYPFLERTWVELDETMDIQLSNDYFSYRELDELYDYCEEEDYDLIAAAVISKFSWSEEGGKAPEYVLTKKGEDFVCAQADNFFTDDRDMKVKVIPEKALPYSWKAMPDQKKLIITKMIIDGYNQKADHRFQYAEHFLACIALNLSTPLEVKELLAKVDSKVVRQALEV